MKKLLSYAGIFLLILLYTLPAAASIEEEENNYLYAQRESIPLHSRLSDLYTGYEFTIKNIYSKPVTIKSINVWDNASAKVAYLSAQKSSKEAAVNTIKNAAAYTLPTLTLSLFCGIIAAPFSAAVNSIANKNALKESEKYDIPQIKQFELQPGKTYKFKTLALNKHTPSMRLIYVNPLTDENMNLEIISGI